MQEQKSYSTAPKERNPDGIVNLCDQAIDRAQNVIDRLEKLEQYLHPILSPSMPVPGEAIGSGLNAVTSRSHAAESLQNMLMKCERMCRIIDSISERFIP